MIPRRRKQNRLKGYNYGQAGLYFATICTHQKEPLFGCIVVGDGFAVPNEVRLNHCGSTIEKYIDEITIKYPSIAVMQSVIMPNHIHLLLELRQEGTANPSPTLGAIIGWFKHQTTKTVDRTIWQRSYYDHVVRDEYDYYRIAHYIQTNPQKWTDDCYYVPPPQQ